MIKQKLNQAGLRLTSQRLKIAEILFSGPPKHFTAEHVYEIIQKQNLNISLATIYNTLRDFSKKRLINEIILNLGEIGMIHALMTIITFITKKHKS